MLHRDLHKPRISKTGTGQNCTREESCTKTNLHQGLILQESILKNKKKKKQKEKISYGPRVRARGNSDRKEKFNPCKIVCSCKNDLRAKLSLCNFILVQFCTLVQI